MNQVDKFTMFEYCFQQLTTRPFKDSDYIQITCKNNKDEIIKAIENDGTEAINRYSFKPNANKLIDFIANGVIEYNKSSEEWRGIRPDLLPKDIDINNIHDCINGSKKLLEKYDKDLPILTIMKIDMSSKELLTYIRDTYLINEYEESDISKDTSDEVSSDLTDLSNQIRLQTESILKTLRGINSGKSDPITPFDMLYGCE